MGYLQTSSGKSKKLKSGGLLLSKKYILSAKTVYTNPKEFKEIRKDVTNDVSRVVKSTVYKFLVSNFS